MTLDSWMCDADTQLAKKLRFEDQTHFQNLVKMHLSFALDVNTEEFDEQVEKRFWVPKLGFAFNKKEKPSKDLSRNTDSDGIILTEELISQISPIIEYLSNEDNLREEGIFRISGASSRQKKLRQFLQNGTPINFEDKLFTVHDCATVLKAFLADLSEPLITDAYYSTYCRISELNKGEGESNEKLRNLLQLMTLQLPFLNYDILQRILKLLHLTASHAEKNKMSAENLATLFTPHLLCPRKISGEALHTNTQMLWGVAVFMIKSGPAIFQIPAKLAADIQLYWAEKDKKHLSPKNNISNESIADSCVVNTVFSFVDRERTAQENVSNPTETALAQLYAHIQSLPESSKKRRLVKQFNKENGYGTPKKHRLSGDKLQMKKRNLGDQLKKHIFSKSGRQLNLENVKSSKTDSNGKQLPNSNVESKNKTHTLKLLEKSLDCRECGCSDASEDYVNNSSGEHLLPTKVIDDDSNENNAESANLKSISTIPQTLNKNDLPSSNRNNLEIISSEISTPKYDRDTIFVYENNSNNCFFTPVNKNPRQLRQSSNSHRFSTLVSNNNNNNNAKGNFSNLTSTPAPFLLNDCPLTASFCLPNDDMSPITMSAQKMPKAMQETMMTPRSRNPVIVTSGSSISQAEHSKYVKNENSDCGNISRVAKSNNNNVSSSQSYSSDEFKTKNTDTSNISCDQEVLSKTFQDYLFSRSIMTASPVDLSFSSRTGDFGPSSLSSSDEKMSDSLLYFLDGNVPPPSRDHSMSNESNDDTSNNHIRETVL